MKYENRLIWVLGITFGFLFFDRNAVNYLMPFIATDLHFTNKQAGLVFSALSFSWAIAAFLGGTYSDRTGRRKIILLVTVVAFSLCSFLSGLVGSFLALFLVTHADGICRGTLPAGRPIVAGGRVLARTARAQHGRTSELRQQSAGLVPRSPGPGVDCDRLQLANLLLHGRHSGPDHGGAYCPLCARAQVAHRLSPGAEKLDSGMRPSQMLRYRNMWLCMLMSIVMVAWMVLGWGFSAALLHQPAAHIAPTG